MGYWAQLGASYVINRGENAPLRREDLEMVAEIQMETQKNTEQAQIHMKGKK